MRPQFIFWTRAYPHWYLWPRDHECPACRKRPMPHCSLPYRRSRLADALFPRGWGRPPCSVAIGATCSHSEAIVDIHVLFSTLIGLVPNPCYDPANSYGDRGHVRTRFSKARVPCCRFLSRQIHGVYPRCAVHIPRKAGVEGCRFTQFPQSGHPFNMADYCAIESQQVGLVLPPFGLRVSNLLTRNACG